MTNAFILCNLLWKVQKSLAANREGSFPLVSLCRIYCRMWLNVKILKFAPILLCWRVKSFFFSWAWFFLNKSANMENAQLKKKMIWPFNKEEWARISKKLHSSSFGSRFGTVGLRQEEHCSNWLSLSLSLLEWPGMTRNDHRMVNLSSFGSRFGTVRQGHYQYHITSVLVACICLCMRSNESEAFIMHRDDTGYPDFIINLWEHSSLVSR